MTLPEGYRLSNAKAELQLEVIHGFLTQSYWAAGIPVATVARAIENSMCVGAFDGGGRQVGFARLITDRTTFAYLADVFVLEPARGQGLAIAMVSFFLDHPELQQLRRWMLVTRDAHDVYSRLGFRVINDTLATGVMERHDPDVYRQLAS